MSAAANVPRPSVAAAGQPDRGASPLNPLHQRWRALAPRERSAVRAVAWLLGLLLVWLIAVQPAWRTLREAPAQLTQVEVQLQDMQRLADEARGLRGASPVSLAQASSALRAATERLGGGARISIQGDRATLTLPAAGAAPIGSGGGAGAANNPAGGGNTTTGGAVPAASGNGDISGDALRGWLAEARSAARARPVDLQLTRSGNGFSGSVVVLIGAAGGSGSGSSP